MNRFIKRNILLVSFFSVALVGMVVMMVITIGRYIDMQIAIGETEELQRTIKTLSEQKPAPSKENIQVLGVDLQEYNRRLDDIRQYFGQPLLPALKSFYDKLGLYDQSEKLMIAEKQKQAVAEEEFETLEERDAAAAGIKVTLTDEDIRIAHRKAEEDFRDYFKRFWEEKREDAMNNSVLFRLFRESRMRKSKPVRRSYDDEDEEEDEEEDDPYPYYWTPADWEMALDAFAAEAAKHTNIPIRNDNREEVFFFAFGVPRDFSGNVREANKMITDVQKWLTQYCMENKIDLEGDSGLFSMPDALPTEKQVGYVGEILEIIADLGVRIAGPRRPKPVPGQEDVPEDELPPLITSLVEFSRIELEEEDSDYKVFRFRFRVYSNMAGVFGIIHRLNDAVTERRFYIIRRIEMSTYVDEAHEIMEEANLASDDTVSIVTADAASSRAGGAGLMTGMMPGSGSSRTSRTSVPGTVPSANPGRGATGANSGGRTAGRSGSSVMPGVPDAYGSSYGTGSQEKTSRRRTRQKADSGDVSGMMPGSGVMPGGVSGRPSRTGMNNPAIPGGINVPGMGMTPGFGNELYDEYGEEILSEEEIEQSKPLAERASYAKPEIGDLTEMEVEFIVDYYAVKNEDFEIEK